VQTIPPHSHPLVRALIWWRAEAVGLSLIPILPIGATLFAASFITQQEPILGKQMAKNNAGGYVFAVDDWKRLERFLILGSEGGTYYVDERPLTRENAECVLRCANADAERAVRTIVEISDSGRAPKNGPAVFALALLAAHPRAQDAALEALPVVCRTATHLFEFVDAVQKLRGWGRKLKRAVANWYLSKSERDLAYQITKYRNRNGWTHLDVLCERHDGQRRYCRWEIPLCGTRRFDHPRPQVGRSIDRGTSSCLGTHQRRAT